jgi:hypothetical protein
MHVHTDMPVTQQTAQITHFPAAVGWKQKFSRLQMSDPDHPSEQDDLWDTLWLRESTGAILPQISHQPSCVRGYLADISQNHCCRIANGSVCCCKILNRPGKDLTSLRLGLPSLQYPGVALGTFRPSQPADTLTGRAMIALQTLLKLRSS